MQTLFSLRPPGMKGTTCKQNDVLYSKSLAALYEILFGNRRLPSIEMTLKSDAVPGSHVQQQQTSAFSVIVFAEEETLQLMECLLKSFK